MLPEVNLVKKAQEAETNMKIQLEINSQLESMYNLNVSAPMAEPRHLLPATKLKTKMPSPRSR